MTKVLWPGAVLFDLDGTLADSFTGIHSALARALVELGLPPRELEWVKRHVGRGARPLLEDALGGHDCTLLEPLAARFGEIYRATYLELTPPRPGAAQLLALAHANTGGRVAVLSNKLAPLCQHWLAHEGLGEWVGLVAGPDTFGASKPDPAAVQPVLEYLGVSAEAALLVGDMPIDALTAQQAGMEAVLVVGGAAGEEELRQTGALAVLPGLPEVAAWLLEHGRGWR